MPVMVAAALEVSEGDREVLGRWSRSSTEPHRRVVQSRALLLAAEGVANEEIARRCETTPDTVRRWRDRFMTTGIAGVGGIAPGRGRKSWLPDGVTVSEVVRVTREERPDDTSTHWSTRTLAERFGI